MVSFQAAIAALEWTSHDVRVAHWGRLSFIASSELQTATLKRNRGARFAPVCAVLLSRCSAGNSDDVSGYSRVSQCALVLLKEKHGQFVLHRVRCFLFAETFIR